jgi:hypothetical protein
VSLVSRIVHRDTCSGHNGSAPTHSEDHNNESAKWEVPYAEGGPSQTDTEYSATWVGIDWIVSANGSVITEGDAPYEGGANELHLNGAIIAGTGW